MQDTMTIRESLELDENEIVQVIWLVKMKRHNQLVYTAGTVLVMRTMTDRLVAILLRQ